MDFTPPWLRPPDSTRPYESPQAMYPARTKRNFAIAASQ
jgi:hypothetical protein